MRINTEQEIKGILGWFDLEDGNIHENLTGSELNISESPVFRHEETHRNLIYSTVFGAFQQILSKLRLSSWQHNYDWPDLDEIIEMTIEHSSLVQEAAAVGSELATLKSEAPGKVDVVLRQLPSFYLEAFSKLEQVLPLSKVVDAHLLKCYQISVVVLARMAMNHNIFSNFNTISDLNLESLSNYLTFESPDRRFEKICTTIAQNVSPDNILTAVKDGLEQAIKKKSGDSMRLHMGNSVRFETHYTPESSFEITGMAADTLAEYLSEFVESVDYVYGTDAIIREAEQGFLAWKEQLISSKLGYLLPELGVQQAGSSSATSRHRQFFPVKHFLSKLGQRPEVDLQEVFRLIDICFENNDIAFVRFGTTPDGQEIVLAGSIRALQSNNHQTFIYGPFSPISNQPKLFYKHVVERFWCYETVMQDLGFEVSCVIQMDFEMAKDRSFLEANTMPGIALISIYAFDEEWIEWAIDYFKKSHKKAVVRTIINPDSGFQSLIISGLGSWLGFVVPCDDADFVRLIDRHITDRDIIQKPEDLPGLRGKLWRSTIGMLITLAYFPEKLVPGLFVENVS